MKDSNRRHDVQSLPCVQICHRIEHRVAVEASAVTERIVALPVYFNNIRQCRTMLTLYSNVLTVSALKTSLIGDHEVKYAKARNPIQPTAFRVRHRVS
jgi:hypothetical protein